MITIENRIAESVHIVPVAREIDRATLPFLPTEDRPPLLHAHRILLVRGENDASRRVADRIERALRRAAIVEQHVLHERGSSESDFEEVLGRISQLCARELARANHVHINLSSGTKLFALAAGLAGMAHLRPGHGSIYYVRPTGYLVTEAEFEEHGLSKGVLSVEEIQLMPILLPAPLQQRLLFFLRDQPQPLVEYRDLITFLASIQGSGYSQPSGRATRRVRTWNNAVTTRMVRSILQPLREQGLIEMRELGRRRAARLTRRGRMYASLVGLDPKMIREPI